MTGLSHILAVSEDFNLKTRLCFTLIFFLWTLNPVFSQDLQLEPIASFQTGKEFSKITVSVSGEIYLLSETLSLVEKRNQKGETLSAFGGKGSGPQFLNSPKSVWVGNDLNVYIADYGNHRITILTRELGFVSSVSGHNPSTPEMAFGYPVFMCLLFNNDWLIADQENRDLIKFNLQFGTVYRFGGIEAGAFQLVQPERGVFSDEEVGVFDRSDSTFKFFDWYGNPVRILKSSDENLFLLQNRWTTIRRTTLRLLENPDKIVADLAWLLTEPILDATVRPGKLYVLTASSVLILKIL